MRHLSHLGALAILSAFPLGCTGADRSLGDETGGQGPSQLGGQGGGQVGGQGGGQPGGQAGSSGGTRNPNSGGRGAESSGGFGGSSGSTSAGTGGSGPSGGAGNPDDRVVHLQKVTAALDQAKATDTDELIDRYAPKLQPAPQFSEDAIQGLERVQNSSLALKAPELSALLDRGFVITHGTTFPTFTYGYKVLYAEHLPLYVTADSILFAMHRSYDTILEAIELTRLIPDLTQLLSQMRKNLGSRDLTGFSQETMADVDEYLTVAVSLLQGSIGAPTLNASATEIQDLYQKALTGTEVEDRVFFGKGRTYDFSQFTPRGHYTDSETLSRYFRAMIWLGRTDFRLIDVNSNGGEEFVRRQFDDSVLLSSLVLREPYQRIDQTVSAFVGEHDSMVVEEVDALLTDLGVSGGSELAKVPSATIEATIRSKGYGEQRIESQIMRGGVDKTNPTPRAFALLGQRYIVDSQVFSNVVYDRVLPKAAHPMRLMPNPLDVGFAVMQNGHAATLLRPELENYGYAPALASMRALSDSYPDAFWSENLYNLWLSGLRALSPAPASDLAEQGLPRTMQSEAWMRRLLNTQLASWAELRHDTILYAKQSYTAEPVCEFPDAYVDPYPEFYARVKDYAAVGQKLIESLDLPNDSIFSAISEHFEALGSVAGTLHDMAEHERTGQEFTREMLDFINQAVTIERAVCGTLTTSGWYPRLFVNLIADRLGARSGGQVKLATTFDPTIADVHTQPADEAGVRVGKVLHVGTGYVRPMVVVAENCSGPRAYVGLTSSYAEQITTNFKRLTDEEWAKSVSTGSAADVPWMADLVAP